MGVGGEVGSSFRHLSSTSEEGRSGGAYHQRDRPEGDGSRPDLRSVYYEGMRPEDASDPKEGEEGDCHARVESGWDDTSNGGEHRFYGRSAGGGVKGDELGGGHEEAEWLDEDSDEGAVEYRGGYSHRRPW